MNVTTQPADTPAPTDQPLTTEELDALEALAPGIFPGPWRYDPRNKNIWDNALPILEVVYNADELGPFVAAAREAIPRLVAENRRLRGENAYLKADTPPYVWMYSSDHYGDTPEPFASMQAARAKAELDYLTGNYADPASAVAEGEAALEWVPILDCDADQLLDKGARTGLIVSRVEVKGRVVPSEAAAGA